MAGSRRNENLCVCGWCVCVCMGVYMRGLWLVHVHSTLQHNIQLTGEELVNLMALRSNIKVICLTLLVAS